MSERRSFDDRGQQVNQLATKDDLDLITEVKAGNRGAFSELVRRHQKALLRLCMRFVKDVNYAQDIVQESFIKAYEKLDSFEGRSSFKSWLFQIGVNTAKNKPLYVVCDVENEKHVEKLTKKGKLEELNNYINK